MLLLLARRTQSATKIIYGCDTIRVVVIFDDNLVVTCGGHTAERYTGRYKSFNHIGPWPKREEAGSKHLKVDLRWTTASCDNTQDVHIHTNKDSPTFLLVEPLD